MVTSDTSTQQLLLSPSSLSCKFASIFQLKTILNEDGEAALDMVLVAPMIHHYHHNHHEGEVILTGTECQHEHHSPLSDHGAMNSSRAIAPLKDNVGCEVIPSSDQYLNTIFSNGDGWGIQYNKFQSQSPLLHISTSTGDVIDNKNDDENSSEGSEHIICSDRCSYRCPLHSSTITTASINNNDKKKYDIRSYNNPKNTEIK